MTNAPRYILEASITHNTLKKENPMKKLTTAALAALALAAIHPSTAIAADPANPAPGAVCNLYLLKVYGANNIAGFTNIVSTLAAQPAAATFVDSDSNFNPSRKLDGVASSWGMWTGWLKQDKAGVYTFLCRRSYHLSASSDNYETHYSIWINGQKCVDAGCGQTSFDVELKAGFNSVKIIAESPSRFSFPLTVTYKNKGSVKDPLPFSPEILFYDNVE